MRNASVNLALVFFNTFSSNVTIVFFVNCIVHCDCTNLQSNNLVKKVMKKSILVTNYCIENCTLLARTCWSLSCLDLYVHLITPSLKRIHKGIMNELSF